MPAQRDYYQMLGVSEAATTDEIKKAFRRLAKQYHPDRNPNNTQAAEHFKEINEAHDVLSDPEKRKKYDHLRRYGAFAAGGACGGNGAAPGATISTCPECGGRGTVSFGQGSFAVNRPCPVCRGKGKVPSQRCPTCHGSGEVQVEKRLVITVPPGTEDGARVRL